MIRIFAASFRVTRPTTPRTINNWPKPLPKYAASKGWTPAQLAIAWVLDRGSDIIPIPGTKRRKYLLDNAGAIDIQLMPQDYSDIETLLARYPNIGDRYNEANYRFTDKT